MSYRRSNGFTPGPKISALGFTLIELIVLLCILGILTGVFITKFSFGPSRLLAARVKMINDIRYAQSLAANRGGRYGVEFVPASKKYSLYVNTTLTKIKDPANPGSDFVVDYATAKEYLGVNLVSANFGGSTRLEFDWRGIPYSGSGSALLVEGTIVIQNSSGSYTIKVTPQTGRVSYQ